MTRRFRTYTAVGDAGGGDIGAQVEAQAERLARRLADVAHVVVIGSGKGGVGKSVVTANLAAELARRGRRVGVLDADLNGPSVAMMLGVVRAPLMVTEAGVMPASSAAGCRVMSMDLLLATHDAPVRWHEPAAGGFVWQSTLETGTLREFLADTAWGELDYLLVDMPPGTDRLARLFGLLPSPRILLLVTTPSAAAAAVVARSVAHAAQAGAAHVVALVSNMHGFVCGDCGAITPLFGADAATDLAARTGVPLWAAIPFDPALAARTDAGEPLVLAAPDAPAARALSALADDVERHAASHVDTVPAAGAAQ